MFRRRKINEAIKQHTRSSGGGGNAVAAAPSSPAKGEEPSSFASATGMIWYKKSTTTLQPPSSQTNATRHQGDYRRSSGHVPRPVPSAIDYTQNTNTHQISSTTAAPAASNNHRQSKAEHRCHQDYGEEASKPSTDYKLPVHQSLPMRDNSDYNNSTMANSRNNIPKEPNTGGFFLDRTLLQTNAESAPLGIASDSRGSADDARSQITTNLQLPHPETNMGKLESRGGSSDIEDSTVRRSLQDKIVMDAFDFTNSESIPLDPATMKSKPKPLPNKKFHYDQHYHQRRTSGAKMMHSSNVQQQQQHAVKPTHLSRKMKSPPRMPAEQNQHEKQPSCPRGRGPHNMHHQQHMLSLSSKPVPPVGSKRRSEPTCPHPPPTPPSPKHYNQIQRRSDPELPGGCTIGVGAPVSNSPSSSSGRTQSQVERDFFRRHHEKMRRYMPAVSPGVVFEQHPPSKTTARKKEEEVRGSDLVGNMNSTIRRLSEKIVRRERELQEKDSQLEDLDVQLNQMNTMVTHLSANLEGARRSARQSQEALHVKQKRVSDITHQIQRLQAELRAEETDAQAIAGNMQLFLDNEDRAGHQLQTHRDEHGSLNAVRQALSDEKACILRDLDNSTSELKSLEAIQNLAMRDDMM